MYPGLKKRIEDLLIQHEAKPEEIQQVYDHQCGRKFDVAWYEEESSEKAIKDYCLLCIMGLKRREN